MRLLLPMIQMKKLRPSVQPLLFQIYQISFITHFFLLIASQRIWFTDIQSFVSETDIIFFNPEIFYCHTVDPFCYLLLV